MVGLATLPPEVLLMIGKQLTVERLAAFASTCKAVRKAIVPLLLEYIHFPGYDSDTVLSCLKHLSPEALRYVNKIVIEMWIRDLPDNPALLAEQEAEATRTWTNVINSLPSLQEVVIHMITSAGHVDSFLELPSFKHLAHSTFPTIAKTRPNLYFSVVVRSDIDERCTMYTTEVPSIIRAFGQLSGRLRIILLAAAFQWQGGERPADPKPFLNALADSKVDIYQDQDRVIVTSNPCIRTVSPPRRTPHLDLKGVEITLNNALDLIKRRGLDLHSLSLSLIGIHPEDAFPKITLPNLAYLDLSCAAFSWFVHLSSNEEVAYLQALERFFETVSLPSLTACVLGLPAWAVATRPKILAAIKCFPRLRKLQVEYSTSKSPNQEARLRATEGFIAELEAFGIKTTLEVEATSIRPADLTVESDFGRWLSWYPPLRASITTLELHIRSEGSDKQFPPDLRLGDYLDFPALESLVLDIRKPKAIFFQASRICSKIRAPRLRHLEVDIDSRGGEPLLHAILAILPEQSSLETLRITAPENCIKEMSTEWGTLCGKLDLSFAYDFSI